ncbi:thiamine pyrophosphate-dependent enzyme [Pelagicoccus sp. SDUM812005]|uniref:dehydrogenase E1 component subunit alpha/beta n=1 Tax=Pelagicoccus sp. SDUM812005 TaxID=3041257 RepID=UPI00280F5DC2|nr:thiamine pyrophosphate-dependent enzyme [Pelagicoccus sp. SDUM812005]MDQ8180929.1 thiamine pyrophosphate-dependent enzyme [Pelagicoccus sp. SDUM812005]
MPPWLEQALLIRRVEEQFLELFSKGRLNGTVHTSVGQELSAIAFAGQLESSDSIFSNHRCHGHYIAFTKDYAGLIAELMGKSTGTCGGIGSSQHLQKGNFYSNGIQGGIAPNAAGLALAHKLKRNNAITTLFIGDGTLGEGVLYETMNIASKWELPLLIVCENNLYAQSTHQSVNLAGNILKRPEAFEIETFHSETWTPDAIIRNAKKSIDFVRTNSKPVFHLVDTYRLMAHSKGDDDRDPIEIEAYRARDPIHILEKESSEDFIALDQSIKIRINRAVEEAERANELSIDEYYEPPEESEVKQEWRPLETVDERQVSRLNAFFKETMRKDPKTVFIGEDVLSPYGGAFKVAKDLSIDFPDRTFSTPISEAAITGIGNGLALSGFKPYVEIMFGDFMLLALDQIVNHASKYYHIYNKQTTCPIVIRTPMGGRRGYGPTHSQSLEKFLVGIDNVTVVALNSLLDPSLLYNSVHEEKHPVVVIENKTDYGKRLTPKKITNYRIHRNQKKYPTIRIAPVRSKPTLTIVTYGGSSEFAIDGIRPIFDKLDMKAELLIVTRLHPLDLEEILESAEQTGRLLVIEEGSAFSGIGSEILSSACERASIPLHCQRVASLPVPIPSPKRLEEQTLPNVKSIIEAAAELIG